MAKGVWGGPVAAACALILCFVGFASGFAPLALPTLRPAASRAIQVPASTSLPVSRPLQQLRETPISPCPPTVVMSKATRAGLESVREALYPMMRRLADGIDTVLQEKLVLSPFALPEDMQTVQGVMESGRCVIENTAYQSPEFRKIHMELATFFNAAGQSTGLDILHCVLFPRSGAVGPSVPIFGCDIVCVKGQITAAIVDLSPVAADRKLAADYCEEFDRHASHLAKFSQPRDIPEFGTHIFSDRCAFVKPVDSQEENQFLDLCLAVLRLHCDLAGKRVSAGGIEEQMAKEALKGQIFYCEKQSQNDKTRRILESAFGKAWSDRYMTTVLFDKPESL